MKDSLSLASGWFRKAESDLSDARRTVASEGPYDTACFHAQQAVEKYLKGVLAFYREAIPLIHNLEELQSLCIAVAPNLKLEDIDLAELTPYAVQLRYDFEFWPDQETARQAVELAERVGSLLRTLIPPDAKPIESFNPTQL